MTPRRAIEIPLDELERRAFVARVSVEADATYAYARIAGVNYRARLEGTFQP